ncbi:hypothetical protein HZS_5818 [Henneguya salminicola]|nr:hypothetical protein HZS_5818 [Henneguya salminicola]
MPSHFSYFSSYADLERHIRDIHCKEFIPNTTVDFNKQPYDPAVYIINSQNRELKEKENIIKSQEEEIQFLVAKNRSSDLYNIDQLVLPRFRGIPQVPFIPVPQSRPFLPHNVPNSFTGNSHIPQNIYRDSNYQFNSHANFNGYNNPYDLEKSILPIMSDSSSLNLIPRIQNTRLNTKENNRF